MYNKTKLLVQIGACNCTNIGYNEDTKEHDKMGKTIFVNYHLALVPELALKFDALVMGHQSTRHAGTPD